MNDNEHTKIKFFSGEKIPLEMHKARMVQRIDLLPIEERLNAIDMAGYNTFLLANKDVFLDMLTDSGVNAMSERQYAAMMMADDSYAGSETFFRLSAVLGDIFETRHFLPAHQGRACENIIANIFVRPGSFAIMNYHFTTTKAHIVRLGGSVVEVVYDEALSAESDRDFKGNFDMNKLETAVGEVGIGNVAFVRIEAGTNLIGGQPVSLSNMIEVSNFCRDRGIPLIFDASLLADNLFFIKTREAEYASWSLADIVKKMASLMDIIYFSGRKLGCARGGGIMTSNDEYFNRMRPLIPLYEGFLTYGGMSVREMEAMAVGIRETLDIHIISQTPLFVEALGKLLLEKAVPIVRPFGGLGCHVDASRFVDHIPQEQYPAGALAAAIYLIGGIRGMERGTLSEQRNWDGSEHLSAMELVRLAVPKRVFTLSHMKFVADRVGWLYKNRDLIGGLEFEEEPDTLRFFLGKLRPIGDWPKKLAAKFISHMPSGM
ncbi:MAG: tryptophanase [Puniceicoccales bacterium]|nr:tryptophanase [Puniceicoccales bacterium]